MSVRMTAVTHGSDGRVVVPTTDGRIGVGAKQRYYNHIDMTSLLHHESVIENKGKRPLCYRLQDT